MVIKKRIIDVHRSLNELSALLTMTQNALEREM
jgi:hypothetical protein